jgi:hypothetical protein
MSNVTITELDPGHFGVQVTEGDATTSHRVDLSDEFLADLGVNDADHDRIVEETFAFLLEREPHTSIMEEFTLADVTRFFPEFPDELRDRLGG